MAQYGIRVPWLNDGGDVDESDQPPQTFIVQEMKEQFMIPDLGKISNHGKFKLLFSSRIIESDAYELLALLEREANLLAKSRVLDNDENQSVDQTDFPQDEAEELTQDDDLQILGETLKVSNCVRMELYPGSENDIDLKSFSWSLQRYDSDQMSLEIQFDNPEYISKDETDFIKLYLDKTSYYMKPENEEYQPVPNNFQIIASLPP